MKKILNILKNKYVFVSLVLIFILLLGIPTLSKLKNRVTISDINEWNGTVASSYKSGDGTQNNPYVISNAEELAYFAQELSTNHYSNTYFELSNDIVINKGILSYNKTDGVKYELNSNTYYVKEYTNNYYGSSTREGNALGSVNTFSSLDNFEGIFNGNSHTIYGLYITDNEKNELGLFTNLKGNIKDLYVENSIIYGGNVAGGIASNTNGASITNVLFSGNVISKKHNLNQDITLDSFNMESTSEESSKLISINPESLEGNITSINITGEYTVQNEANVIVKIDNNIVSSNNFNIDLGTTLKNKIEIKVSSDINTNINFSNLKYTINYDDSVSSGIVGSSVSTTLTSVINNSNIYGGYITSGLVGKASSTLELNRTYNTGSINGDNITSGLVGKILDSSNVTINKSYNTGNISSPNSSAFIGKIDNSTATISNSFNTSLNYSIGENKSSIITVTNSYNTNGQGIKTGSLNGTIMKTTLDNLKSETFIKNTLGYNEFVDYETLESDSNKVWIIENGKLPILYLDNVYDSLVNLNLSKYSWNNYSKELNVLKVNSNVSFNVDSLSNQLRIKKIYYYVLNSTTPLSKDELNKLSNWTEYSDVVSLNNSGYYIVYVKVVDTNDNVSYVNSDVIALNLNTSKNISLDNYTWDTSSNNLNNIYIDKPKNIIINAHDDLIGIKTIHYYVSSTKVSNPSSITNWIKYENYISLKNQGKHIIYAKIVDNNDNTTYLNTDVINYNGYTENLTIGKNSINYNSYTITKNSAVKLQFTSNFDYEFKTGDIHALKSSILLPIGTNIKLLDYKNKRVYNYTVNTSEDIFGYNSSCSSNNCTKYATYEFSLFKEVGKSRDVYYSDEANYNKTINNENFTIIVDFKNSTINQNYMDTNFSLVIKNSDSLVLNTLNSTVKNVSIINDTTSSVDLNNNYTNQVVNYNLDADLNINLTNRVNYTTNSSKSVINTTYEEKNIGLLIKFTDSNNNNVSKEYLNNLYVEMDNNKYYFDKDNTIKIIYGKSNTVTNKTLKLVSNENSNRLSPGIYYLKISNYLTRDKIIYDSKNTTEISIPVLVSYNTNNVNYTFDVTSNDMNFIKNSSNKSVTFNIKLTGNLNDPTIKVSLYEKSSLTAYNQDYTLVNLSSYVSNSLTSLTNNKYYVGNRTMNYTLNLVNNNFNNNGYKYLFELYDGDTRITKVERYFIVN